MKSILSISIILHAAIFSAAAGIGMRHESIHPPATTHKVLEMRLATAPCLRRAPKSMAPAPHNTTDSHSVAPSVLPSPSVATDQIPHSPAVLSEALGQVVDSNGLIPASTSQSTGPYVKRGTTTTDNVAKTNSMAKTDYSPWTIASPAPEYPRAARRNGWIGRVGMHVLISDQGTVQQVELLSSSGHKELDLAAVAALHKWLFHPAQKDGHPIAAWVVVPVLFRLDE